MDVRVGLERKLSAEELMLLNCGVGEDSWESWDTFESALDSKEIQPVHPKGNQSWMLIGRTDAEAETPFLWLPDAKNWLIVKDPDAGKDWRQEEKGTTEDEMVGWHHRLNGHEFEQAPGVGDGQGSLACCSPWGQKESNMSEQLNWTDLILYFPLLLLPSIFPSIRVFSNEFSEFISFTMDWFDFLAIQGTLNSLLNTIVQKHQFFSTLSSLWSNCHIHTWLLEKP